MQIEVREATDYSVMLLSGDIDLSTSPHVRTALLECLAGDRSAIVDLSGVTYIDSSGIASLVEGYQIAKTKGLKFCLVGVSEAAMSVLELARLDKVFPIFATEAECWDDPR
ncbi:MAG: STAS domain-containing protein [Gammaproteobacteria bacterium]|nr:STAS domain-containing protein [Gammaproteobacteria bacterium]